jgi:hypothetical protein
MKKYYKIHEIETNVTYDDIYETIEATEEVIESYKEDDADDRNVTYEIVEF